MALVLKDRVQETSTSTGNSTFVLSGAVAGYQSFATAIPDGSIVYYCIAAQTGTDWEVGYGTFDLATTSLLRNTGSSATSGVYSSSNADAYVTFGAGTKNVFVTYPAEQAVFQQPSGITEFNEGPISVVGANATPASFEATLAQFFSNVPSFSQLYVQNQNSDANASSDIVAYNNLGDGTSYFVDMGINSSNYNSGDYPIFQENDAYLFNSGNVAGTGAAADISRLLIGTGTANSNVVIFGGSVNAGAEIATFVASTKDVNFANNISATSNVSANNVIITNFAYSGANLANAANGTVLVTKTYVDDAVSNGFHVHTPVNLATTAPLSGTPTYNQPNGSSNGVGATLTATGVGLLDVDGVNADAGFRILVQSQANAVQNGIYTVTTEGTGGVAYQLTRATDADTYVAQSDTGLGGGDYFFVDSGDTQAYFSFICTNDGAIVFGTTPITFQNFAQIPVYTGTAPINVSSQTIALTGVVNEAHGGTNTAIYTTGDTLYANATNTLNKLNIGSQYNVMAVSGSGVPHWSQVNLGSSAAISGSLGATNGGTGQTTYTTGDILYSSAANTLSKLAGQTTTTQKFLGQTGDGVNSAAPAWSTVPVASITGLAPSATTDTTNATNITSGTLPAGRLSGSYTGITGVGTLTAGTWNANVVTTTYGGTGAAGTLTGLVYGNGASAMSNASAAQVVAVIGSTAVANATYAVSSGSSGTTTTASNIAGGAAGGIPYQTGASTTAILATGSGVLVGGTTPSYSTAPALTGTNFSSIPNSATTATAANTASAIVARDASGNFTAGTITATTFSGSGASLTNLNGSNVASGTVANARTTAVSTNTANAIVTRDASGNFAAGTITANLTGTASSATSATTAVTVTQAAQANITSVGTLTSLTSSGTIQSSGTGTASLASSGDITAIRSGGTTGVIYFGNTGGRYLYYDGTNYNMPGGQLLVNSQTVLNSGNYTSYAPSLTGSGASGTWGINVTGSAGSATTATTATNLSGGTVSATTVQATGGFTATSAAPFYLNATTVSSNFTVPASYNAVSAGPITINTGVTVTVSTGSTWVVV